MQPIAKIAAFCLASCLSASAAWAVDDTLMNALESSKASGRGLTFYANGQAIPGVVVAIEDRYLVARSQAQGTIIIRLDRIDGVAGFINPPAGERKPQ
ncbi:MAG: hypothetical protein H6R10_2302 [Rhodocyclaceae bacterium]|nr:hypothetical protein [Rhodocyclaceae bacterium]